MTDVVGRVLHERLWRTAEREMAATVARLGDGRARAEAQCRQLQTPLAVDEIAITGLRPDANAVTVEGIIEGAARVLPR